MADKYDVIIIGAGPGGMTAGLYAARANLKILVLDRGPYGGQMNNTDAIDNYPGFSEIKGPELSQKMYDTMMKFEPDYKYGNVQSVELDGEDKLVKTDDGNEYRAPIVIIATGSDHKHLNVPGEEEYSGKGVSYCAVCDAAFFKDEDVAVIGGGDSAIEEGIYLTQLAQNVNVIHRRDQLRAQAIIQQRAFANDKMTFTWDTVVKEIKGDGQKVTGLLVHNKKTGEDSEIEASGVFIYVGIEPMTEAFQNLGITDEAGWIETNDRMETKIPGIYALGDVRKKNLRQITTAVGDGGIAGQEAFNYVQTIK